MHTASDSTRRTRYTMRWFRTCPSILRYAHRSAMHFKPHIIFTDSQKFQGMKLYSFYSTTAARRHCHNMTSKSLGTQKSPNNSSVLPGASSYPRSPNLCTETVVDCVSKPWIFIQCSCMIAPPRGYE